MKATVPNTRHNEPGSLVRNEAAGVIESTGNRVRALFKHTAFFISAACISGAAHPVSIETTPARYLSESGAPAASTMIAGRWCSYTRIMRDGKISVSSAGHCVDGKKKGYSPEDRIEYPQSTWESLYGKLAKNTQIFRIAPSDTVPTQGEPMLATGCVPNGTDNICYKAFAPTYYDPSLKVYYMWLDEESFSKIAKWDANTGSYSLKGSSGWAFINARQEQVATIVNWASKKGPDGNARYAILAAPMSHR